MSLSAIQIRQTLPPDALLDTDELLLLLPGDRATNARWLASLTPALVSPSGVALHRWETAALAFGLNVAASDHDLLTVAEVAALLRVPESRIYQLTSEKRIPYLKLGHRTVRFDRAAILDWTRDAAVEHLERPPVRSPRSSTRTLRRKRKAAEEGIAPFEWKAAE